MKEFKVSFVSVEQNSYDGLVMADTLEEAIAKIQQQGAEACEDGSIDEDSIIDTLGYENFEIEGEWVDGKTTNVKSYTMKPFKSPVQVRPTQKGLELAVALSAKLHELIDDVKVKDYSRDSTLASLGLRAKKIKEELEELVADPKE